MQILSAEGDGRLSFTDLRGDTFRASITGSEYCGSLKVDAYTDIQGLARLFISLATEWKGWKGEKEWSSIEQEFIIVCTHDGLGHVTLDVTMDHRFGMPESWCLQASIVVEAGQLGAIARDARAFIE